MGTMSDWRDVKLARTNTELSAASQAALQRVRQAAGQASRTR
ncbi:hypothetical protein GCM10027563_41090 [Parasphingorhabdus pacifica]